ncbi:class I SAM-dependent methyltransferase [Nocardioides cavernaquae]|uniref:Class I SAM-dependent methyltransferase n=1 Tax=Nocardioides cavernaquae TaxID=2321396 RepID=A0A3A5HAB7_9ACTN|nr:class I SAM-dependent methyltransferase [Nocardioides cavernaquae]RJS44967.1 class I SAM-dependent methyltransferase [Nocardioides cavernaquae]
MPRDREPQLAYSELQYKTHDEEKRRQKAAKIVAVLQHFLGRDDLTGLSALDIGASTGYTVDALATAGATTTGIDIDEPGISFARSRFGDKATFTVADGSAIPAADQSFDIVVFNHIYEHVVDADAVMAEIVRTLRPDGVAYLGFGNKWAVVEPHYRLPFLSWLPEKPADRYVAAFKRADSYYERFRSRRKLITMCRGLRVWDYTYTLIGDAEQFHATDVVPRRLAGMPIGFFRALRPVIPTFIWIGTPGTTQPQGPAVKCPPSAITE